MSQEVSCGSLSSLVPKGDLVRREGERDATVPGHRASWLSFRRAACLGSASRWVSFPPGAWKRAGRWGWRERHAGRGGAGAGGRNAVADSGTASSRTPSEPPGPSPAETPRGRGPSDHRHLSGGEGETLLNSVGRLHKESWWAERQVECLDNNLREKKHY